MTHATNLIRASLALALVATSLLATPKDAAAEGVQSAGSDLDRAYKREFAFLDAERNALKQRIADLDAQTQEKLKAARAEVDALQGRVMASSLEADRLNDTLGETERTAEDLAEGSDVIDNILSQAGVALEKGDIKLPELKNSDDKAAVTDAKIGQMDFAFGNALQLLSKFSQVREEHGSFFGGDGTHVDGTVVHVGQIAAYGVSDKAAGALAPAGAGDLGVWPEQDSASAARAFAKGEHSGRIPVFLFESLDKPVEAKAKQSAVEHITAGGSIAWVIVGGGVLALLMILARVFLLLQAAANTGKLVQTISPLVEQGSIRKAIEVCRAQKNAAGRVLRATLDHIDRPREEIEDIIAEAILHEQPVIDRFAGAIMVVAAVSPLLGLLGTVTGMISTFDVITEFGTGNPKLLSGGISVALITTEIGLIVAIPTLLAGNLLSGWADRIKDDLDKSALRITNLVSGIRFSSISPPKMEEPEHGSSKPDLVHA